MSVNKVILVGRLGKDPEIRYTPQQMAIGNFSLATSERRKDATGNWAEQTEWHNIVCFGKVAENCHKYIKKGKEIYLEGRIQTRKWQDKEGTTRYTTEIVASTIQFLGSNRSEGARDDSVGSDGGYEGTSNSAGNAPGVSQAAASHSVGAPPPVSFEDDDIPF